MDIIPVKQYHIPKLPTRHIIDEHPELLRLVPRRWQANPIVLSALAGLCVVMSGCKKYPVSAHGPSRIAPVFQHGVGRGGFGCIAINPPVVLSEDEARQVIVEEAKRQGVSFLTPGLELSDVLMTTYNRKGADVSIEKKPLVLDGQDTRHKVFFEYVSSDDLRVWQKPPKVTVDEYDTKSEAVKLRSRLRETKSAGSYGVFYDPLLQVDAVKDNRGEPDWTATSEKRAVQGKQMAEAELRKQVQDFIKWLKTQGVI